MKATLIQMFHYLNHQLFNNVLTPPTIEYSLNRHFALRWEMKGNILHIGRTVVRHNFDQVAADLVHEMVHMFNSLKGIEDIARNQYHKKQFMDAAISFGLYVQQHKRHGWSITSAHKPNGPENSYSPAPAASERLVKIFQHLSDSILSYKSEIMVVHRLIKEIKPSKCYFLKYCCQCPPPYNSIRSGRRPDSKNALDVWCKKCGEPFLYN